MSEHYLLAPINGAIARRAHADPDAIRPDHRLAELDIGSFQFLQLVLEIEETLRIELTDNQMGKILSCSTVGEFQKAFEEIIGRSDE